MEKIDLAEAFDLRSKGELNGLYDMKDSDYRAAPGLNQSLLKNLLKSPATFANARKYDSVPLKSKALDLGTLIHCLILEGEEVFNARIAEMPDLDPRTKIYKEAKAEQEKLGKIVLNDSDKKLIYGIWESYLKEDYAQKIFSTGQAEVAAFGTHRSGLLLKGKVDYIRSDILVDLKTTLSGQEHDFKKTAKKLRYDLQAVFYLDLINYALGDEKYTKFGIVTVEKSAPYLWNYFFFEQADIEKARNDLERILQEFRDCERKNIWPGYDPKFKPLKLWEWEK